MLNLILWTNTEMTPVLIWDCPLCCRWWFRSSLTLYCIANNSTYPEIMKKHIAFKDVLVLEELPHATKCHVPEDQNTTVISFDPEFLISSYVCFYSYTPWCFIRAEASERTMSFRTTITHTHAHIHTHTHAGTKNTTQLYEPWSLI